MNSMFESAYFNGDISGWNVSKVDNMDDMFRKSSFSGDIAGWNIAKNCCMKNTFAQCPLEKNPPAWCKG